MPYSEGMRKLIKAELKAKKAHKRAKKAVKKAEKALKQAKKAKKKAKKASFVEVMDALEDKHLIAEILNRNVPKEPETRETH